MQQLVEGQASPEAPINENFETLDFAAVYGKAQATTTGLTWGYYGGRWSGIAVAAGTLTLTNNATNYVVVNRSTAAISASTSSTNWDDTDNYAHVYKVTTSGGVVTATEDHRAGALGVHGGSGSAGASLAGLSDVDLSGSPADGDVLQYSTSLGKWVDAPAAGGSVAGSNKQVQYNNSGSFGAESGFEYDQSTNVLTVRTLDLGSGTTHNANGLAGDDEHWLSITNDPAVVAGGSGAGRQMLRINSYASGGYGGNVHFCRYRGTEASPTAVQSGDTFMSFGIRGWHSGGALSASAASFAAIATENWTSSARGIKWRWEVTPIGSTTRGLGMELDSTGLAVTGDVTATGKIKNLESFVVAASDESTALTTGTVKMTFRMPYAFTLSEVRASLTVAQTSGSIFTVDINESGSTILSTKLTIDNTERTSTTAATPAVISDTSLADDAEITIDIDQVGDGTAKGLKVTFIGRKT